MTTKNLTSEGREMVDGLASVLKKEKISIDITTRAGVETVPIEPFFTGQVVLHFNQGGFAGADTSIKMKIR